MINKKTIKVEKESAEELKKWISEKEITPLSLLESLEKDVNKLNAYTGGSSVNQKDYRIRKEDVLSLIKQYKEQLK